jgi:hypothetical protein
MSDARADRLHLIECNYDKAVATYESAQGNKFKDPVVLILDPRDSMARKVVGLLKGEEFIKEALHVHGQRNEIATAIMAVERGAAGDILSNFSPSARASMEGGLPILACVATGGTAYALMEVCR